MERVFGDGGYITRTLQQRFSYDEGRLKEILAVNGLWESVLAFDSKKLVNLAKSLPHSVREEIEKSKTLKTEFKMLKAVSNTVIQLRQVAEDDKDGVSRSCITGSKKSPAEIQES